MLIHAYIYTHSRSYVVDRPWKDRGRGQARGRGGIGRGRQGSERKPTRYERFNSSLPRDRYYKTRLNKEPESYEDRQAHSVNKKRPKDEANPDRSDSDESSAVEEPRSALNVLKKIERREKRLRYGERVTRLISRRATRSRSLGARCISLDTGRNAPVAATSQRLKRVRKSAESQSSKTLGGARVAPRVATSAL